MDLPMFLGGLLSACACAAGDAAPETYYENAGNDTESDPGNTFICSYILPVPAIHGT